jgi:hypothetical protein
MSAAVGACANALPLGYKRKTNKNATIYRFMQIHLLHNGLKVSGRTALVRESDGLRRSAAGKPDRESIKLGKWILRQPFPFG